MIKINLLGDTLAQVGGKKADKAEAVANAGTSGADTANVDAVAREANAVAGLTDAQKHLHEFNKLLDEAQEKLDEAGVDAKLARERTLALFEQNGAA